MEFASITITAWFNGRFVDDGTDVDDEEDGGDADEGGFEEIARGWWPEKLWEINKKSLLLQKEIIDTLQTMGIIFCVVAVIVIGLVMAIKAYAETYQYTPKDYTRQQKIHRGEIILPIMTTCRLMKQKVFKDKMACIYIGAQKTFEMENIVNIVKYVSRFTKNI